MRLGLLTGAAATLVLIGGVCAHAETIYVTEPPVIETAPGYVYSVPEPVVTGPAYAVPPGYVVVAPRPGYVVNRPVVVAPRDAYDEGYRVVPRDRGIVTTGYSTTRCITDMFGFERCF